MQNIDSKNTVGTVELTCWSDAAEAEPVVVFELLVPVAAKVPAPRPRAEIAQLVVLEHSVTSTVPGKVYVQLLSNSTAVATSWRSTATLASAPKRRRSTSF